MNYYFYFENILFEYLLCEFLFYYYEFEFLNWISQKRKFNKKKN